ncbi:caspase family protein [Ideonella livida]|uniref:Caspase family protein n=1 Tax=Ideonella livida TaxID=2707176 RepID=A0A7C9PJB1_9BURK|nr:caspase family protein [Ideonella livida]NDY93396.1 caspase family protein [Ideonella livida]
MRPRTLLSPLRHALVRPLLGLALATALTPMAEAARLALVLGNYNYQNIQPALRNARNDAQTMARELESAGFSVTKVMDGTRASTFAALDGFLGRIRKGDEVVFFFSGHGSQPPSSGPMLLPVDIQPTSERSIQRDAISLDQVMDDLNKRARFVLMIIDACRDDPFRQSSAGRSIAPGSALGRVEPPSGTLVIMAASKGQQALDRLSDKDPVQNGLFTRELVRHMRTPGLSASEMARRVKFGVEQAALSINHQQRPAVIDESSSSEFYFYPPSTGAAPAPVAPLVPPTPSPVPAPTPGGYTTPVQTPVQPVQPAVQAPTTPPAARPPVGDVTQSEAQREFEAWDAAMRNPSRAGLESFLSRFPQGRYAGLVRTELQRLGGTASTPAAAPAAPRPQNPQAEFEFWESISARNTRQAYEEYLQAYPNGRYVDIARARMK